MKTKDIFNRMGKFLMKHIVYVSIILVCLVIFLTDNEVKFWKVPGRVIAHDVKSYYAYLPAVFIHRDISLDTLNENFALNNNLQSIKHNNGKFFLRYTMGNAIMYLPFFIVAHVTSPLLGYEQNGYTSPYKIALLISSAFFLIIGLLFLRKYLLNYYSPISVAIALFAVVVGTNLLFYSTFEAPMPHVYGFSLIAAFLYMTTLWYKKPNAGNSITLGIIFGLISLIRPSNIIVGLFFVLYNIRGIYDLKDRARFLLINYRKLLFIIVFIFLVWIPQLLYWKYITGQFLFYSYEDQGFNLINPQIINSLFSYKKGWFIYTPIMLFAVIGLFFLRKYQPGILIPLILFLILNIYILSSWFQWYFGGSFGLRAYIDSYGILIIPLAALIQFFIQLKNRYLIPFLIVFALIVAFNVFQTWQYYYGSIHWVNMNKESYWESFGKLKPTERFYQLIQEEEMKDNECRNQQ
ncbi:MAG: hypothetical protein KKA81_02725 [Bacteroidetes bacterium]|nr:hypothetical protein [Bacteroidota bacterium]